MTAPFTPEELILIEVANQTSSLLGHHHHGHHDHHDHGHHAAHHGHGDQNKQQHKQHHEQKHVQFKAPEKLTTDIGLYALKKLNVINPTFLKSRQARLLQPVTPGPITYFINAGFYLASGGYGVYLWRTRGLKGFATLAVLPLVALVAGRLITNEGLSYARQGLYYFQRKQLVNNYTSKYGENFLLSVLNPAFRI